MIIKGRPQSKQMEPLQNFLRSLSDKDIVNEKLKQWNTSAEILLNSGEYEMTFDNDESYINFVLVWS